MDPIRKRLIMIGDEMCGKTSLCIAFVEGTFEIGVPATFEYYVADVEADGKQVELALCDAPDSPDSLVNVEENWISEASCYYPFLPILLVGCKKDLRDDPETIEKLEKKSQRPVTSEEGSRTAEKISAYKYLECSAKTGEDVYDVFQHATRAALLKTSKRKPRRRLPCLLL